MSLIQIFAAAILSLSPKLPPETADRYATDIANAVDGDIEIGVALIVTIQAESTFREDIEHCVYKPWEGDRDAHGKPTALGLFQLHFYWWDGHSPEEICASNTLATILAAREFRVLRALTGSIRKALRRHVGELPADDRRVVDRPKNFDRLLANARRSLAVAD